MVRQSMAMLPSHLDGPSGAADLHVCKTWVRCAGEVVGMQLDCLPMGMPRAGCNIAAPNGGWPL